MNDKATLSFELTVDGDPPADTTFFGNVRTGEGGPGLYVALTDPDEDHIYTGSTTVDRFGPGPRPVPPGTEPVSLPVQMVQGSEVIKDFGTVRLDGDKTFSASVSFPVDDCPISSPTPSCATVPAAPTMTTALVPATLTVAAPTVPVPAAAAVAPMVVAPATPTAALWVATPAVLDRAAAGYPMISPTV